MPSLLLVMIAGLASLPAGALPVFSLTKSAAPSVVRPGDTITYTVCYRNTGNSAATNVALIDALPQNLSYVIGSANNTPKYAAATHTLSWNIGTLPASGAAVTYQITFKAKVDYTAPLGQPLLNTATLASNEITTPVTSNTTSTMVSAPALSLAKSVSPTIATPGSVVTFTLNYANVGTFYATNALISDQLPLLLTPIPASLSGGIYNATTRTITWSLSTLNAGAGGSVSFQATIDPVTTLGTVLTNTASFSCAQLTTATVSSAAVSVLHPSGGRGDWWLFRHDLKHTGRSTYTGPSFAKQKWVYTAANGVFVDTSPAIASDGTIYVGANDNNLYAVRPDGKARWTKPFATGGPILSSAAIGADGVIYVGSSDANLYAIYPDGALKWSFATGGVIISSPTIGTDGTIYVGAGNGNLYALKPDGTKKWAFATGGVIGYSSPAIGSDGIIYVGAEDNKLYAITATGTAKWAKPFATSGKIESSPAIGGDGVIYVGSCDGKLYAINPSGTAKWTKPFATQGEIHSSPAIGADGTLYFSSCDQHLYAVTSTGTQKWTAAMGTGGNIDSSPTIGADGTIYVGSCDFNVYAINVNGTTKWKLPVSTVNQEWSSPAIGADGTLYIGTGDGQLFAINGQQPVLTLTKSVLPSSVLAGTPVTFSLSYANTSTVAATNAVLTDALPAYLTYVSGSSNNAPSYDSTSRTLKWSLGKIPAGGMSVSYIITFKALVDATAPAGALLTNTAAITCDNLSGPVISNPAIVTVIVPPAPKLRITKTASPVSQQAGGAVTYTLNYGNFGSLAATGAKITDVIPAHTTYVQGSAKGAIYTPATRALTWTPGTINAGATSFSLTFKVTIDTITVEGTTINNTASLTANGITVINSNTAVVNVGAPPISAWWMFHHDAQRSGRSSYGGLNVMGPTVGKVRWTYPVGGYGEVSPTIGADGTIYIGSTDKNLYAINPDGTKKWTFTTGGAIRSSPMTGADGTIYTGSEDGCLYAINPNGTKKWAYSTGSTIEYCSAAQAPDGTVYIGAYDGKLYAINADGTLKWAFTADGALGTSSPALGYDGTVYFGTYNANFYAVNADGTQKWMITTVGEVEGSPVIASDNTIYVGFDDNKLHAFNPDGTEKWAVSAGVDIDAGPAVGPDATIYIGSCDDNMYALNPDGTIKWVFACMDEIESSPIFSADGTIYFGSYDANVYALNQDGTKRWSYATGGMIDLSSPAFGPDGTMYITSSDGKLYAFGGGPPAPALLLNKSVSPTLAQHGDVVTYAINYRNVGTAKATSVTLTDTLPAHITYVTGSVTGGGVYDTTTNTITWSLGTLNGGATSVNQVTFQATVNADAAIGANIANTAGISCTEIPKPVASGPAVFSVPTPNLTLSKTVSPNPVKRGDTITYTITYRNTGTLNATSVSLSDALPAHITYVAGTVTGGGTYSAANDAITWSLGTLNVGASAQVTFQATVNNDAAIWSYIANTAVISCTEIATPVVSNTAGVSVIDPNNTTAPWPMCQFDPQHSGRCSITGPSSPNKHWAFSTGGSISDVGPSIGADGTIYIGSYDGKLYALNLDGSQKWAFKTNSTVYSTAAIGKDGTVYFGSYDDNLYALKPDGTKKWSFKGGYPFIGSPVIATDGTIYAGSDMLYALNADGTKKWGTKLGTSYLVASSPALGTDGTIYVGGYDGKLYAVKPDGTVKWSFATGVSYIYYSSPTVGTDGTIYIAADKLYAVKPDGTKKWSYSTSSTLYSIPALAADGTIYVGDSYGYVYAVNPDGTKKWTVSAGFGLYYSSPIVGGDGTIYLGSEDSKVYALNPADGSKKWTFLLGGYISASPALGPDGSIYIGANDKKVYAIGN